MTLDNQTKFCKYISASQIANDVVADTPTPGTKKPPNQVAFLMLDIFYNICLASHVSNWCTSIKFLGFQLLSKFLWKSLAQ